MFHAIPKLLVESAVNPYVPGYIILNMFNSPSSESLYH